MNNIEIIFGRTELGPISVIGTDQDGKKSFKLLAPNSMSNKIKIL